MEELLRMGFICSIQAFSCLGFFFRPHVEQSVGTRLSLLEYILLDSDTSVNENICLCP